MNWRILIILAGTGWLAAGCHKKPPLPVPDSVAAATLVTPAGALPPLPTIKLWLGADEMTAELAVTPEQLRIGLMFRTNINENDGMLFVFDRPVQPMFWMKDTSLALSAAFLDPSGTVLECRDFEPFNTNPVAAVAKNVQYVLEARSGWFDQHHIVQGTLVRAEQGTLPQVLASRRAKAR